MKNNINKRTLTNFCRVNDKYTGKKYSFTNMEKTILVAVEEKKKSELINVTITQTLHITSETF